MGWLAGRVSQRGWWLIAICTQAPVSLHLSLKPSATETGGRTHARTHTHTHAHVHAQRALVRRKMDPAYRTRSRNECCRRCAVSLDAI